MGILVENYTTQNGQTIPQLYIYVKAIRIVKDISGSTYTCSFHCCAHMSYQDRLAGTNIVLLNPPFLLPQKSFALETLLEKSSFSLGYEILKEKLSEAGYVSTDA